MSSGIEGALTGRITSESIELRRSAAGKAWTSFSVRVGDGDAAEYVRITAFGSLAERLCGELEQGAVVHCSGRLELNRWRKDGVEKVNLQMVAWHCEGRFSRRHGARPTRA
jgi:single-stranded DNA-binding protein